MTDPDGLGQDGPVTTIVTRTVPAERREDYEAWLHRLLVKAEHLDGFLGADVHRPSAQHDRYTSVFRFATPEHLEAFQRSDLFHQSQAEAATIVDNDPVWDTHTGFELWFSPPPGTNVAQPVRWRMALLIGAVVYVLVLVFGALATAFIGDWPTPLRLAIVIAIEITLMTYVLLPWLTKRLATWIYPINETA
ncbi:MAG: antibiotic biosynthesis monooxygenase [Ilumatobacter sp.]|uniref:antibiotic biosynthesis monooxygenase n=1 Tax=Ilumatobacter sp. TaxID=1967498 RepID=UPI0032968DF4